jgi:hypothetical protein
MNGEYLADAWAEAYYQNPLIMGISDARIAKDGKSLLLFYEDDEATRESKKAQISAKVTEVVAEIIDDDMSLREREYAINDYLCATAAYDDAALENAALYNYESVDAKFNDSFTAYGVLINNVGVCSSYAAAFKLLADASGLECVVVTGTLDGTLAHAWNRVALENNQWATVDSTNNDTEIMVNALLNAPDYAIATTLVEDYSWIMDDVKANYSNSSDADEFYHVQGLFFDKDTVTARIIEQLNAGEIAVVRTDYMLTDLQFYDIAMELIEATGNENLGGGYWMGVIVVANDPSLLV